MHMREREGGREIVHALCTGKCIYPETLSPYPQLIYNWKANELSLEHLIPLHKNYLYQGKGYLFRHPDEEGSLTWRDRGKKKRGFLLVRSGSCEPRVFPRGD